jgi:hypothetical protein
MKKTPSFSFHGDSICEWASRIDQIETTVHYGDEFELSIRDFTLTPALLSKLRCLNVADFEIAEKPNAEFRKQVIIPLLNSGDDRRYLPNDTLICFLKREWSLTEAEIESAGDAFVSIKWLMSKQSHQTLNSRLHQAFDYIQLFYDIYSLECNETLIPQQNVTSEQFLGLFERYHKEANPWIRFAMGYVFTDLLEGRSLSLDDASRSQVSAINRDYAHSITRWTGRKTIVKDNMGSPGAGKSTTPDAL